MPVSMFQIDFKNKIAKRGYQWGGKDNSFLIPVRSLQETEEVRFTTETFSMHFQSKTIKKIKKEYVI